MSRVAMPLIKMLGIEGKKIDIVPRTEDDKYIGCVTELWNKKGEVLGVIGFDKRKRWNRFVLLELDEEMQMSKDCLDEAFKMCERYWADEITSFHGDKNNG